MHTLRICTLTLLFNLVGAFILNVNPQNNRNHGHLTATRRDLVGKVIIASTSILISSSSSPLPSNAAMTKEQSNLQSYPDFTVSELGFQYKDVQPGQQGSPAAKKGVCVCVCVCLCVHLVLCSGYGTPAERV